MTIGLYLSELDRQRQTDRQTMQIHEHNINNKHIKTIKKIFEIL